MGKYLINGSKYEIDESIQGDELTKTLEQLSGQPTAPSNSKRDAYLSETDRIAGLTPGTSARQIDRESRFDPQAVSPAGARGLAQVMPATTASLSKRMGRELDPHNEDDALLMHRELMTENMKHFGNQADALRAYNAGWDKTKWDNKETNAYVASLAKGPYVPFAPVQDKVDPSKLGQDADWLRASKQLYSMRERKQFVGSDNDLAEWGKGFMGNFNANMVDMTRYAHDVVTNGTPEDQQAFLYMMDTYDNTEFSWEGAGRAVKGIATDPTSYVGLGTLGVGTMGKVMASAAAKQGVKKVLLTALGRTGIIAGVEGSIYGGAQDAIRQGVEVNAGRKDSFSIPELAGQAGVGAAAGVVLGTAGDAAVSSIVNVVRRNLPKRAPKAPTPLEGMPVRVEPTMDPSVVAVEAAVVTPGPLPETILTDAEIVAATARKQEGRLPIDDLPPVTPANPEAAARIEMPDMNTGLRSTPRSMAELTEDGGKIAAQLRSLDDETMHGVLESFRTGSLPLEDSRVIARGVQMHADELRIEQAELIKKLGLSTNAQETTRMVERLEEVDKRLVPLSLADDAFGSMAGSMLRQRQEGLPGLQGVTVESLMAEKGLAKEAAEDLYVQLVDGARKSSEVDSITRSYDLLIQKALDEGNTTEAARLQAMKGRELDGIVDREIPGSASYMAKFTEAAISNVMSPSTVLINLVPAAAKTLVIPALRALVTDPLKAATRAELAASYGAMRSTVGSAMRAAKAAYLYEQSLLTRGSGKLLEGELAIEGRKGGIIRFIPRVLNATDEFLAQINYNGFVAGQAAAKAVEEGAAKGMTGGELSAHIKQATEAALKDAFKQPDADALIQPLVNKGVNLGYTGQDLSDFVMREAGKNADAFRHGNNEEALDFVRDVLYKRRFSGKGWASGTAQLYEQAANRAPGLKLLVGQLFFRTPVRVFEEGMRLTPGLQIVAPGFLADLAGKHGVQRQARAQGEALTSLAITGAVFSLYAQGRITGDGAYDNWRQQRTHGDGPAPGAYTIRMADGSTQTYRNFDPLSTPIKIIINGLERLDKLSIREGQGELIDKGAWDQALAYVTTATGAIATALRDANLVEGLNQSIKLGENLSDPEGKEDAWLKWFGEKLSVVVPNTLTKIAKQNDPTIKDPADFWQVVESRLAGLYVDKEDIKTSYSYDVLGNVRRTPQGGLMGSLFGMFMPVSADEATKGLSMEAQKVLLELDRLQKETPAVFSAPLKHKETGDFDLRTVLTADKQETLYDRWQRNYRELEPEKILLPILTAPMPDGTLKVKGLRVETVQKVMGELRDAAFMKTMAQEQRVLDEVIDLQLGKAKAKSGLLDFQNRDK